MATVFTDRFGFPLLTGGSDYPDPDMPADAKDINDQIKAIDAVMGFIICTSGTRPSSPRAGQPIVETDTKNALYWDGTAWVTVINNTPVANTNVDNWMTMQQGWTLNSAQASWTDTMCMLRMDVKKTVESIPGVSHGNIVNDPIWQIKAEFSTFWPMTQASFATTSTGPLMAAYMNITGDGQLSAMPPDFTLPINDSIVLGGTYLRRII